MSDDPAADNPKAFKHWFSPAVVDTLGRDLARLDRRAFDRAAFDRHLAPLPTLELKARVALIAEALHTALRLPYPHALGLFLKTLPPPHDPAVPNGQHLLAWPLAHFVGRYGPADPAHLQPSLGALHALTQRFTGEFDLRPFILAYPARTFATLSAWTADPSEHVRRLVSEGTRTRLPWGIRLQPLIDDPSPVLPLLDALHADPSEYVRRSVANNLNDLAKDHPALVVDRLRRWSRRASPHHDRLARHALRTLVKAGDPRALALLGVDTRAEIDVADFSLTPRLAIGETLTLGATLHNPGRAPTRLVVDFAVRFASTHGPARAPKVFKWKTLTLGAGETVTLDKRHPMRVVTTRKLVPGEHAVTLQVNGEPRASATFELTALTHH